ASVVVDNPFVEHGEMERSGVDLLGQKMPRYQQREDGRIEITMGPAECFCVATSERPVGLHGEAYRAARARAAWAMEVLGQCLPVNEIKADHWRQLADGVDASPEKFLASIDRWPGHGRIEAS